VTDQYKTFPPKWRHIKIPTTSKKAAKAGLALYAPCRPRGILLQKAAWLSVAAFGPWVLPGRSVPFHPPDQEAWLGLVKQWNHQLGPIDGWAIIERRQASRSGLAALLLRKDTPVAFVRVIPGFDPARDLEVESLRLMGETRPSAFWVPRIIGSGSVGNWGFVALTPLAPAIHKPPKDPPLRAIISEIQVGLAALFRPDGIPSSWQPMHGDFTPWNLRQTADGSLALLDWETTGWGPPEADLTLYRASEAALGWRSDVSDGDASAASFWRSRLNKSDDDRSLQDALDSVLAAMAD